MFFNLTHTTSNPTLWVGGYTDMTIKVLLEYSYSIRKVNGDFRVQMKQTRVEKLLKLLPSDAAVIAKNLAGNNADADKQLKERLPTINCECGAKILLLPDLPAMNRAIKAHVAEHRKKRRNEQRNVIVSSNISQLLSELSLIKISAQNDI
jgi:hypothetical protein